MELNPGSALDASGPAAVLTAESARGIEDGLGLNKPLHQRLAVSILNILSFSWGESWATGQPVSVIVSQQAIPSIKLALGAIVISWLFGVMLPSMAVISVSRRYRNICHIVASIFAATPLPVTSLVLIGVFAVSLQMFPATGDGGLDHQILPSLALGLAQGGTLSLAVLQSYDAELTAPYFLALRAKGLSRHQFVIRHGLRAILTRNLDLVFLQIAFAFTGTVLLETIFARPGVGRVLAFAVLNKDLPIVQVIVAMSVIVYGLCLAVSDLIAVLLDPRINQT
jgi:ABC-type dipeptide/oligopeptide/nickel transport system permease component